MYQIDYTRAISNEGNCARIKKVMKRAMAGEALTIGFLGGSITMGSVSTRPELCYAYRVFEWWQKSFPKANFTYVNAGIGATDSQFGCARVEEDLLAYHPDFVIVEFSVNDTGNDHYTETYEGLVRKILSAEGAPALLLVHNMFYNNGDTAQLQHGMVAKHYNVPAVSMKDTIYPEVAAGRIPNREITPDDLHPNDAGHELVASVITYALERFLSKVMEPETEPAGLPAPMTRNAYENSVRFRNLNADQAMVTMDGFSPDLEKQNHITDIFRNGFTASKEGAKISFTVEGDCIGVQYRKTIQQPAPIAKLVVDGDEANAVILDANFEETWGDKLVLDTVLDHGTYGKHQVDITLVTTHEQDVLPFYLVSVIGSSKARS